MDRKEIDLAAIKKVHFMGVGGSGMSGLAMLFDELGYEVSGCDVSRSHYYDNLLNMGIKMSSEHSHQHLDDFDVQLLAYSSAIPEDNSELKAAREKGIPVLQRAELLSLIFDSHIGIGVAGTHGKTTTSSMIGLMLSNANLDPTVVIGGEITDVAGSNAKIGKSPLMVAELDESDGSFKYFHPYCSIITNIDWDHVNHYPSLACVKQAFTSFIKNTQKDGKVFICAEDHEAMSVLAELKKSGQRDDITYITYGASDQCDWAATDITYRDGGGISYNLLQNGKLITTIETCVSGYHNVLNSLVASAVALTYGAPIDDVKYTLLTFKGVTRRLQKRGEKKGILVYDDYGHHPRELRMTIDALKKMYPTKKIAMVFQPHRYTRTQALAGDFAHELSKVSKLILLPIYGAGEREIEGVSSELIYDQLPTKDHCCVVHDKVEAMAKAKLLIEDGDVFVTAGAGDVCVLGDLVLQYLDNN